MTKIQINDEAAIELNDVSGINHVFIGLRLTVVFNSGAILIIDNVMPDKAKFVLDAFLRVR